MLERNEEQNSYTIPDEEYELQLEAKYAKQLDMRCKLYLKRILYRNDWYILKCYQNDTRTAYKITIEANSIVKLYRGFASADTANAFYQQILKCKKYSKNGNEYYDVTNFIDDTEDRYKMYD